MASLRSRCVLPQTLHQIDGRSCTWLLQGTERSRQRAPGSRARLALRRGDFDLELDGLAGQQWELLPPSFAGTVIPSAQSAGVLGLAVLFAPAVLNVPRRR